MVSFCLNLQVEAVLFGQILSLARLSLLKTYLKRVFPDSGFKPAYFSEENLSQTFVTLRKS